MHLVRLGTALAIGTAAVAFGAGPAGAALTCDGHNATIVGNVNRKISWFGSSIVYIEGTAAADWIVGTDQNDLISGLGGNDHICGRGGADSILGGDGNDYVSGNVDGDLLYGQAGDDTLLGGPGNDTIVGGTGQDTVSYAYAGEPFNMRYGYFAGSGDFDQVSEHEIIRGTNRADTMDGRNTITGTPYILYGLDGNDVMFAGYPRPSADPNYTLATNLHGGAGSNLCYFGSLGNVGARATCP